MGVQDRSLYICAVRSGMRRIAFLELQMMLGEGLPYLRLEGLENCKRLKEPWRW